MISGRDDFSGAIFSRRLSAAARSGAALLFLGAAWVAPAHAQNDATPVHPPGPGTTTPARPPKIIKFTLVFARPGSYSCYLVRGGRKGEGISIQPGQTKLPIEVSADIDGIEIVDEVNGLVATRSLAKIKNGGKVRIRTESFDKLQVVVLKLRSKNGQPAAKGVVRLEPSGGEPLQYSLNTMDNGSVRFENIPLGKAEASAYATTGDDVVKRTVIIAPSVGGKAQLITLTLPVDVRTVESPGAAAGTTSGTAETKREPRNDIASGLVGIGLLVGLGAWGVRYLKQRGMTPKEGFADALRRLGVDSPGAPVPGSLHAGLRSSAPDAVHTPLPSLAELPEAGAATGPVVPVVERTFIGPRLVGLSGEFAGRTVALQSDTESRLTIGREPDNTIPLPLDNAVSRRHGVIVPNGSGWDLMDEGSQNGTFVNGMRIESRAALTDGDTIQVGKSRFRFEA